jgi:hypothetical protein
MKTIIATTWLFFLVIGFNEQRVLLKEKYKGKVPWNGKMHHVIKKEHSHDTLSVNGTKANLQLSFILDVTVRSATGERIQLQKLIDQKKYIFVNVWLGKKGMNRNDAFLIDSIAGIYKNKLMVIGLLDGTLIQLKRMSRRHPLKNVQAMVSADIKKYQWVNTYPNGILFSKTGKLVQAGMNAGDLKEYMEKHVDTSRAKF